MHGWQSSFAKSGEQTAQSIEDKWICQFHKLKSRVVTPVVTTFIVVDNKLSKSSIGIVVICSQKYIRKDKQKESSEANSAWEVAKIGSVQAACLRPIRLL